jgi:hypothetical protein
VYVTPTELRVLRRGSLLLRFAVLDSIAAVLAELPAKGSLDTTLEQPCTEPHWGVLLRGDLEVEQGGQRRQIRAGAGFHVPGGEPGHRFFATRRAVIAGFVPLEGRAAEDALPAGGASAAVAAAPSEEAEPARVAAKPLAPGEIRCQPIPMGPWVFAHATFGPTSGYGTDYCDAPHWGVVITGSVAIEFEDDVEVLSAGDFYYTAHGPPGHRFEVADGAIIADFTPRAALEGSVRLVEWREVLRSASPVRNG